MNELEQLVIGGVIQDRPEDLTQEGTADGAAAHVVLILVVLVEQPTALQPANVGGADDRLTVIGVPVEVRPQSTLDARCLGAG